MKTDMSAYGVTELTPAEASATSGGVLWGLVAAIVELLVLGAAVPVAATLIPWNKA
ncbi:hypothetical protein [Bradyrhizobium sp. Cp5.3]|uniref:hypothetical protein n=1 Tax=Bradyrhizobium sp. Cp5.3 TaxID=443598 RepID=UPI0012EB24F9|nr:hypothetical protein [Bradyrhizobium sp. Cp5.3]